MKAPLQWGWKVECRHPNCNKVLERWSEEGVPGLPYWHGEVDDWYWRAAPAHSEDGEPLLRSYHRVYDYIAYCPEHKEGASEYEWELTKWKNTRREVGRQAYKGFCGFLEKWTAKLLNQQIGQTVEEWEQENPRPRPPWETTT